MLHPPTDISLRDPNAPPLPVSASELVPEWGYQDGDLLIALRQWGAFYDTGFDQQLRRRGVRVTLKIKCRSGYQALPLRNDKSPFRLGHFICRNILKTLVIGGVATNAGVKSTAQAVFDLGDEVVLAEDAMSRLSADVHRFVVQHIFGLMGRVLQSSEMEQMLAL